MPASFERHHVRKLAASVEGIGERRGAPQRSLSQILARALSQVERGGKKDHTGSDLPRQGKTVLFEYPDRAIAPEGLPMSVTSGALEDTDRDRQPPRSLTRPWN